MTNDIEMNEKTVKSTLVLQTTQLHSPNTIPNRYNTNNIYLLKAGNIHYLSYNFWNTVLLPHPIRQTAGTMT